MARWLGLDVGDKRVGVALSDETGTLARPLEIIDRGQKNPYKRVVALAAEHAVAGVVIGLPLNEDGTTGVQAAKVREFCDRLGANVPVPIHLQDERWSSSEAGAIVKMKPRKVARPAHDDAVAAAVILQRFLDEKHKADR